MLKNKFEKFSKILKFLLTPLSLCGKIDESTCDGLKIFRQYAGVVQW